MKMVIDPLKNFPGYALRRASSSAIAGLARRLSELGLRPTEGTVLVVIGANPGITQSEAGQLLDVARANMVPLTARLLERDLIVRERVDGRSQGLILSAAGRQLTKKVLLAMSEHEETLLAKIPRADHAAFLNALHALWAQTEVVVAASRRPAERKRAAKREPAVVVRAKR